MAQSIGKKETINEATNTPATSEAPKYLQNITMTLRKLKMRILDYKLSRKYTFQGVK